MKTAYITKPFGNKIAVLRVTAHYPRGLMVTKAANQASADYYVIRQLAEDHKNRLAKVRDYLAERAARVPVVAEPSNQIEMF